MTTLFEDLRLALRQICSAIGLSGTAATVVPLVVLGVALNVGALSAMESIQEERHTGCQSHNGAALRSAARTELKVVRTVLTSTLRKLGSSQRWCVARQWVKDRRTQLAGYRLEVDIVRTAPSGSQGCEVEILGGHLKKVAIAYVPC
jgi:hypothetical protein